MSISQGAEHGQDQSETSSSDSSRWLLAQQRLRESGIPPAHERLWSGSTLTGEADEHIEAALAECTRAEANLGSFIRGLTHLAAGANAACEANATLLRELDQVRDLIGQSHAYELVLRHRVQSLEHQLEIASRDAAVARTRFIEQEDRFLAELLTDHERQVSDLRNKLARAEARNLRSLELDLPSGPEESLIIPREAAERPDSLAALALAERARAAEPVAEAEEAPLRLAPISTMPPPPDFHAESAIEPEPISTIPPPPSYDPEATRAAAALRAEDERRSGIVELAPGPVSEPPPSSRAPDSKSGGTLMLKTISVGPAPLIQRRRREEEPAPPSNRAPGIFDVDAPFPAVSGETLPGIQRSEALLPPVLLDDEIDEITEVKAAVDLPESRRDSKPVLKPKPDPATRPLVSYSLGSEDVAEEHVDTSRVSSRPPTRS
jgi:hypothetical protein